MRSGLQTPGAIPLLAVMVAALLSITPMLCEALTRADDAPSFELSSTDRSVEAWRYAVVDSVPTTCEHVKPCDMPGSGTGRSLTSTFNNMATLWQQVCHLAAAIMLQQDTDTIHNLKRGHDDLHRILKPPLQEIIMGPSNDNDDNNDNTSKNNSIRLHPPADPTSITISLASLSDVAAKSSPLPPPPSSYSVPSSSPASSPQRPSAPQSKIAVINASSPVDRKGSYMAILVSLVVAIMWF